MHWHKILTPLCAAVIFCSTSSFSQQSTSTDAVLLQMQQALRKGDQEKLTQLLPLTQGHPLEAWAAYWELKNRLKEASEEEVDAFLLRWRGSYHEDRLRNDWLRILGGRRDWSEFTRHMQQFRMQDDKEVRCYELAVKAIEGVTSGADAGEVQRLWYAQPDSDDGCTYAASELYAAKQFKDLDIWKRARIAAELNRRLAARRAVTIVESQLLEQVTELFTSPVKYLTGTSKSHRHIRRELAVLALVRLAATDPEQAANLMDIRWNQQLHAEERDWVWGVIGKVSGRKLSGRAVNYFDLIKDSSQLSDETQEWMARAYLRAGQWHKVRKTIEKMPLQLQANSTWVYWLAQALRNERHASPIQLAKAKELLKSIAGVSGFYEQLALEDLGQAIEVPAQPEPLTHAERAQAQSNTSLQRALYAMDIGLRSEGVREWNYAVALHTPGGMSDRELLAAAELACAKEIWDRCINTSERTREVMDWRQRFPLPFRDTVIAKANEVGLDPAYVYGLIRQESRFVMNARSHVGASGLMQVMPATAKWTAKKIGMTDFELSMLNDQDTNITIGTAYLKLALDDFEGSKPLAAAGYNAGPGRPRNWRNGPKLDGAVWAENVPFSETRDYVKKVLSNTINYAALITGKPQSLKAHLGTIGPKVTLQSYSADLP